MTFPHRSKGKPCLPFGHNARIHIPENTLFTYPDIAIFCGEITCLDDQNDSFLHPSGIVEILSPSTRRYDRGKKFELYKQIPSLKEYILVDTKALHVLIFRRQENNSWKLFEYSDPGDLLTVETIGLDFLLCDIYANTRLLTP